MTTKRVPGSVKNKITATEILEERAKCDFDQKQMEIIFFHDKVTLKAYREVQDDMDKYPEIANTHKFYEMTREEM
jgi:acyl-CoA oxidase